MMEHQIAKKKRRPVVWILILLLCGILIFSITKIYEIYAKYHAADVVYDALCIYKPTDNLTGTQQPNETLPQETENKSIVDMQSIYPDVCGWLTVDDTKIDYPFAQSDDNNYYLHRALGGKYLFSGTLFLDCRCQSDLSSPNSIIYGHQMKNNTMFSGLYKFRNKDYFDSHTSGTIYLAHKTYQLEIIAYLIVRSDDSMIYSTEVSCEQFLSYVKKNARQYREVTAAEENGFLTLSTCSYEFDNARSIVVARLIPEQ